MTMPTAVPIVQTVNLAPPGYPMLTRMVSDPLFPETKPQVMACPHCKQNLALPLPTAGKDEPITWIVGQRHPLVPDMKVMRMFIDHGGVEVYSVANDGKAGMRNLVPMTSVRLTEEAMPMDVFAEELAAAEEEDDDSEPEETGTESEATESETPPAAIVTNGQTVS